MILDDIRNLKRYVPALPALATVEAFLTEMPLMARDLGRYELDGPRLYVSIEECTGRGREASPLEIHRRYVDVQLAINNHEVMGWRPLHTCTAVKTAYNDQRDIGFFADAPVTWYELTPGLFTILFPEDAHAPLAGKGPVRKAVFKIQIG